MSFCGHQAHVTKAKDEQLQQGRLRPGFDTRWSQEVAHLRDTVGARWIPKEKRQGLEPDGARHWGPQEGCTSRKGGTCTQPAKRTLAAADGRKTRLGVSASKLPVPSHRAWLRLALAGVALGCTTCSSREPHTYKPGSAHWATLNKQRDSVSRAMSPWSGHPGAPQTKASTITGPRGSEAP